MATTIKFNPPDGITVLAVRNATATQLDADIAIDPTAAVGTRQVTIVTTQGESNSKAFNITAVAPTPTPVPTIATMSPSAGSVGTAVIIIGTNFGTSQGTSRLTFNGIVATIVNWTATRIDATVPSGATTGNVCVVVGAQYSNAVFFTVTTPTPSPTPTTNELYIDGTLRASAPIGTPLAYSLTVPRSNKTRTYKVEVKTK